ncbi:MAG: bifunctional adenosylcobinamide kinase/adenosylcobinamide-phosphate guanylyltransferase [Desulfuromonas sp.]|jgi:adenosylcobinamide kinase/adenosylcobinamide-phosphate guanylyltransferase|nr:MAG: bifunctional adenosylcobinamide kinase/adenosylcobinamide-phosphate guanylyltransferase [Desulfuromonas sp.]
MGRLIYVTGGARSGKSRFAQQLAEQQPGDLLYIAPAQVLDPEMADRVEQHRLARGERWTLLEEPLQLAERLAQIADGKSALLLDCVTIWLSNLFFHFDEEQELIIAAVERLTSLVDSLPAPLYMVSNEVGSGIVPENAMARSFRDLAGAVNQQLATAADEAWLVVSGLPLRLK